MNATFPRFPVSFPPSWGGEPRFPTVQPLPGCTLQDGPGLQRYPVGEQQAQAAATVDHLHAWSDYFDPAGQRDTFSLHDRPMLTDLLRTAAVLLDEYRAGSALEHPHPRSGWVLVPATLPPKLRAAVEGLIFALEEDAEDIGADIAGGRAVLQLLAEFSAGSHP
jgi:hypothetical protein